jgi:hypothetical protein
MYVYNPTIKCNLAEGLVFWSSEQMVTGSNPTPVNMNFIACNRNVINTALLLLLLLLLLQ